MRIPVLDFLRTQERVLGQQAHALWAHGFGRALGYLDEFEYIRDLPNVPSFPPVYDDRFDRLVLVDTRVPLETQCELLGVGCLGNDKIVDLEANSSVQSVFWMMCQDGSRYISKLP
ncbi:MAG: hypothetical protein AAB649_06460, partial [Patescibacteria group bacterium]